MADSLPPQIQQVVLTDGTVGDPYLGTSANPLPVTSSQVASTTANPFGITVSTMAVQVLAANSLRKEVQFTNNGASNLYFGKDNTVTTSGATMGGKMVPNGTGSDGGASIYQGAWWAIGDAAASTQNLSVTEFT